MNYVELQHMEKFCIRVSTAWNLAILGCELPQKREKGKKR